MNTSATTPMTKSSDQPISKNIGFQDQGAGAGPPRGARYSQKGPRAAIARPIALISWRGRATLRARAARKASARLGAVAASPNSNEATLRILHIDIDDRDRAAGASHGGGRGQMPGRRRAQVIDPEIDRRDDRAEAERNCGIAGRVHQPRNRAAMP